MYNTKSARLILFITYLISLFILPNSASADDKLTNEKAYGAIWQFMHANPKELKVIGVRELPQQNAALVDFTVTDWHLERPKNDAITAYALGPGGGTFLWSGPGTATFVHYNNGTWVLTTVSIAISTWDNLNFPASDTETSQPSNAGAAPSNASAAPSNAGTTSVDGCKAGNQPDLTIEGCTAVIQSGQGGDAELPKALLTRAFAYFRKGEYEQAIADYSHVILLQPDNAMAFEYRCWIGAIVGHLDQAMADCNQTLTIQPKRVSAQEWRGLVNLKMRNYDAAIVDYTAVITSNPKEAISLYGRGLAERMKGQTSASDADISAAKTISRTIADSFVKWGVPVPATPPAGPKPTQPQRSAPQALPRPAP
jgi:tetratricopeptide (TPR) repeat protein